MDLLGIGETKYCANFVRSSCLVLLLAGSWGTTIPVEAQAVESGQEIMLPAEGSPAERMRKVWEITRPVLLNDARAGYDDTEYLRRGTPVWDAWTRLSADLGTADAENVTLDAVRLIEDLYGRDYNAPERRERLRERTINDIKDRITAIEDKLNHLQ